MQFSPNLQLFFLMHSPMIKSSFCFLEIITNLHCETLKIIKCNVKITQDLWAAMKTRRKVLKVAKIKDANYGCKDEGKDEGDDDGRVDDNGGTYGWDGWWEGGKID